MFGDFPKKISKYVQKHMMIYLFFLSFTHVKRKMMPLKGENGKRGLVLSSWNVRRVCIIASKHPADKRPHLAFSSCFPWCKWIGRTNGALWNGTRTWWSQIHTQGRVWTSVNPPILLKSGKKKTKKHFSRGSNKSSPCSKRLQFKKKQQSKNRVSA